MAASIFQAVVDQTVAGLTQGRELKGKIVFLGGPLHFLMGLRQRFVETLKLDADHAVFPEDGDCFAAMGAACAPPTTASAPLTRCWTGWRRAWTAWAWWTPCPPPLDSQEEYDAS